MFCYKCFINEMRLFDEFLHLSVKMHFFRLTKWVSDEKGVSSHFTCGY